MGKFLLTFLLGLSFSGLSFSGCTTIWVGSSESTYAPQPQCKISPQEARDLAEPWLDQTYRLRSEGKVNRAGKDKPLRDYIVLRGNWYYVSRDNYPFKTFEAYRFHAVKVHKNTGEVIPPK